MSTNFNTYNGIKAQRMNIADLEVGQTLVRLIRPKDHWDKTSEIRTTEYTVKKVLKTRLVLESKEPYGTQQKIHELRLVVEQSKWSIRAGEVTTAAEGTSNSYNRTSYEFATVDEPAIQQLIDARAASVAAHRVETNAKNAIAEIARNLGHDLESIDKTIEALTALRNQMASGE